jgi:AraC-like DNA-binding protein
MRVAARRFTGLQIESIASLVPADTTGSAHDDADRLGYESEPLFSRAFKRLPGAPPSALRRAAAR